MNKQDPISWKKLEQKWVSRRNLIRGAAGAALGTSLLRPNSAYAGDQDDDKACRGPRLNPIPGGGAPFKPFGVIVHHNPLNPATPLANISDPSQITDFDGFVGLTHIRGAVLARPQASTRRWRTEPTWALRRASSSVATVNLIGVRSSSFDLTCTPFRLERPASLSQNKFTISTCTSTRTTCSGWSKWNTTLSR